MDTKPKREVSEQEAWTAIKALEEWTFTGKTDLRCPWCGGEFTFVNTGNSSTILCKKDKDFVVTIRGL
jgi:hypothetical protein